MPVLHTPKTEWKPKDWRRPHSVCITAEELDPTLFAMIRTDGGGVVSNPPVGSFKVTNVYVDANGKFIIKWSDTPQGE